MEAGEKSIGIGSIGMDHYYTDGNSNELQDILSKRPSPVLRWSMLGILLTLLFVMIGSWYIRYPDIVQSNLRLTSVNAPKALIAHSNGKIIKLFAQEGAFTPVGTSLAYLESTANHDEVLNLLKDLDEARLLANNKNLENLSLDLKKYQHLGELQNNFESFIEVYVLTQSYLKGGAYVREKNLIARELFDIKLLKEHLEKQKQLQSDEIKISFEDYKTQKLLAISKVIAPADLRREESKYLLRKSEYQKIDIDLINNDREFKLKQKEILEIEKTAIVQKSKFLQSLSSLISAIQDWKAKYIITSSISGYVNSPKQLQENEQVQINQELFYISPKDVRYIGELKLSQQSIGKVEVGQTVFVKFPSYPYQEYGSIMGRVSFVSQIPLNDSVFLATVIIPSNLKTFYGKRIAYRSGMTAYAEVVTRQDRLLSRVFYQLRSLVRQNK